MSIQFAGQFQTKIYELLSENQNIKRYTSGVYLSMQKDAKYPFILINILNINDVSKQNVDIYEVDLEICVFAKEKAQQILFRIASDIITILKPEILSCAEYSVLSIKENELEFIRGHDLHACKALVKYKALLQGKIIEINV